MKYDTAPINKLLRLPYKPRCLNEVECLINATNIEEISKAICKSRGTRWTILRDEHAHFPSKDLQQNTKVWHHFIGGRVMSTMHTSEVTKEWAMLLYGIKKGLKINVGGWINSNICHTISQRSEGIPYPTLLMELIASHGIDTIGQEVLKPKDPLDPKAIECIVTLKVR